MHRYTGGDGLEVGRAWIYPTTLGLYRWNEMDIRESSCRTTRCRPAHSSSLPTAAQLDGTFRLAGPDSHSVLQT